jgi:hypothetical protein
LLGLISAGVFFGVCMIWHSRMARFARHNTCISIFHFFL